jgi:hypothetical protein
MPKTFDGILLKIEKKKEMPDLTAITVAMKEAEKACKHLDLGPGDSRNVRDLLIAKLGEAAGVPSDRIEFFPTALGSESTEWVAMLGRKPGFNVWITLSPDQRRVQIHYFPVPVRGNYRSETKT